MEKIYFALLLYLCQVFNCLHVTCSLDLIDESFLNWEDWKVKYGQCNPQTNPFTSPIPISTRDVVQTKDGVQLFVHSQLPEADTYRFSSSFEMDGVKLEGFNIKMADIGQHRHATFISGVKNKYNRFFENALIMFRPGSGDNSLRSGQSLHTIDKKIYPMEIMFTFNSNSHHNVSTQVHVMVDVSKTENPAWTPVLNTFLALIQQTIAVVCFSADVLTEAKTQFAHYEKLWKAVQEKEKQDTDGSSYQAMVAEFTQYLEKLKGYREGTMQEFKQKRQLAIWEENECSKEYLERIMRTKEKSLILNLKEVKGVPLHKMNEKDLQSCIQSARKDNEEMEKEIETLKDLMRRNAVSLDKVNEVEKKLPELVESMKAANAIRDRYKIALREMESAEANTEQSVKILDPFQISWLFPSTGGFFMYEGSSVVPPCQKKSEVIVLETPITISHKQLEQFRSFPSFAAASSRLLNETCTGNRSMIEKEMPRIRFQVPPMSPLNERLVQYSPMHLQFMSDDGFHMSSKTRRNLENVTNAGSTKLVPDTTLNYFFCTFLQSILAFVTPYFLACLYHYFAIY